MLSKNKIKLVKSLDNPKYRRQEQLFVVEGEKLVNELFQSKLTPYLLFATKSWIDSQHKNFKNIKCQTEIISEDELKKISFLKTPPPVMCLVKLPDYKFVPSELNKKLSLALDTVQDPGNLGTIIRIADWFGIENIICSSATVDAFNPKVVQSAMGGLFRVKVHYVDLIDALKQFRKLNTPIFGAMLDGINIYGSELTESGIIVMGNESKGISTEITQFIDHKIYIPKYPESKPEAESLNVANATAIICSEFRRRLIK